MDERYSLLDLKLATACVSDVIGPGNQNTIEALGECTSLVFSWTQI